MDISSHPEFILQKEVLGAEIKISRSPDRLQTEISATSTEMTGGSPPADVDICIIPDLLPITKVCEDSNVRQINDDGYSR